MPFGLVTGPSLRGTSITVIPGGVRILEGRIALTKRTNIGRRKSKENLFEDVGIAVIAVKAGRWLFDGEG